MATNFPTSQDSLTNPTSSDTLDSPDHAAQHTNVNDAVEAIELALLDGAPLYIDDANERVGIGTTSPVVQLHLMGDDDREALRLSGNGPGSTNQGSVFMGFHHWNSGTHPSARIGVIETDVADYDGFLVFQTRNSDSDVVPSTRMVISESGSVGIGTDDPQRLLDIRGASSPEIRFQSTDSSDPFIYFGDQDDAVRGGIGFDISRNDMLFRGYNNSLRMTIDDTGHIGIGTQDPNDLLDVGDSSEAGSFRVHASGGSESFRVVTTVVRSTNIVNLTTSSSANMFINTSNNSIHRSTSSAKYKSNIETLEDEYADLIFKLRPVWYRSATGNDPEGYSYYGLIAEEVAEIEPRLVHFGPDPDYEGTEDEDGHIEYPQSVLTEPESVEYDRIVPHLINVVQRQKTQIDALEARIAALES